MNLIDHSGEIAESATAQELMPANTRRGGWRIQNIDDTDVLWFNDLGGPAAADTAGSTKLAAGAIYQSPPGGASTAAISIVGASAGHKFTAMEW